MDRGLSGVLIALLLVPALIAAAAGVQRVREQRYPPRSVEEETLLVTSGDAVRRLTTGYRALAADVYWIRAIQHYGRTRIDVASPMPDGAPRPATSRYELLYPLLDVTTTLDPLFNIAYRFGAIFLAAPFPEGPGRPDLAVALLEKGLRESPGKWEYMHDIGFVYYWDLHDYPKAAEYFNRAADIPGAPWWMRTVAATTLGRGGNREASRLLWRQIFDTAPDDRGRRAAGIKLLQLDALDQIEALQTRVDGFARQHGGPPAGWKVLVDAHLLSGIPVDPDGTPYELSALGVVSLSTESPLFPLPLEPAARAAAP